VCVCVEGGGGGCFIDNRWVKLKHMLHDTKYMYQQKVQAKVIKTNYCKCIPLHILPRIRRGEWRVSEGLRVLFHFWIHADFTPN
jgi:hypothetical protein